MKRGGDRPRKARGPRRDRPAPADDAAVLARSIAELGLAKKAQDVVLLDLRDVNPRPEVDFFVLMNSVSPPHQRALADHILDELDKGGRRHLHLEGYPASGWILIDYIDVVVHIFRPDSRNFYALETLWGDAAEERIDDTPPAPRVARGRAPRSDEEPRATARLERKRAAPRGTGRPARARHRP